MDQSANQLSLTLERVAKALAEWTVERHAEADETLATRYGHAWRSRWVVDVEQRIRCLAQSLAVRRPSLFADTVAWSGTAITARAGTRDDLQQSLRCLRAVIADEMPAAIADAAVAGVDEAIADLAANGSPGQPVGREPAPSREVLEYLEAALSGRRREAERLVLDAAAGGATAPELYKSVLGPALVQIGRMWHRNEVSIADEHIVTNTTEGVMALLRTHFDIAPPRNRRVIATSSAGEQHAVGVRMVADLFELDGWEAILLGANVPTPDVVDALKAYEADLLAASVTSVLHVRTLGGLVDAVRDDPALGHVRIIVGGAPFAAVPDLWEEIGADAGAADAEAAVRLGNALVEAVADGRG